MPYPITRCEDRKKLSEGDHDRESSSSESSGWPRRVFDRLSHMRFALAGGLLLLIGLMIAFSARSPNLAHVRVGVLLGDPRRTTMRSSTAWPRRPGCKKEHIDNIPSVGSVGEHSPVGDQPSRV